MTTESSNYAKTCIFTIFWSAFPTEACPDEFLNIMFFYFEIPYFIWVIFIYWFI